MIPEELKEAIQKLADEDHRSLSSYVMLVLLDHVKSKDIDIEKSKKSKK